MNNTHKFNVINILELMMYMIVIYEFVIKYFNSSLSLEFNYNLL